MAYQIDFTENAEKQLDSLIEFHKEFNEKKSQEIIDECFNAIELLRLMPYRGRIVKDDFVRRIIVRKHIAIYYVVLNTLINIIGVFDLRQNPEKNPYN